MKETPIRATESPTAGRDASGDAESSAKDVSEGGDTETVQPITAKGPDFETGKAEGASECKPPTTTAPSCGELESGSCAEAFGAVCHLVAELLTPDVAVAAVNCLVEKNQHSRCAALVECVEPALKRACVEPADRTWCQGFLKRCPAVEGYEDHSDQESCEHGRASLLAATKEQLDACLGEGCELADCLAELDPSGKD